jgi:cell division control protein 45
LIDANESLIRNNHELRSVIMLNCGGGIDLARVRFGFFFFFFFFSTKQKYRSPTTRAQCLTLPEEAICYVIDSHRPYRLENAFDENQILILDDGRTPEESLDEYRQSVLVENEQRRANEETTTMTTMMMTTTMTMTTTRRRRRTTTRARMPPSIVAPVVRRRRRGRNARRKLQLERRKRRRVVRRRVARVFREPKLNRAYYEMTSFGLPVSFVAYELLSQLGKTSNELLWLAIVGLTDQYVHEHVNEDDYNVVASLYTDEVLGFNDSGGGSDASLRAAHRIVHQDEFDLMLLRHWTLYDSLVHSRYVATRLGAWKERGTEEIGRLLVTMGLPLDQCREPYATMRATFKEQLADRLDEFAPRFGLPRLRYPSFHRQLGFKQGVSAADVVHAVTALLEAPDDVDARRNAAMTTTMMTTTTMTATTTAAAVNEEATARLSATAPTAAQRARRLRRGAAARARRARVSRGDGGVAAVVLARVRRAACGNGGAALLERGIRCAKRVQQAIVREGSVMLERKSIVSQGAFRYAFLTHSSDAKYFARPLALSRLARFLVDARRTKKTGSKSLVLLALDEGSDSYLIVGVEGGGSNVPSAFGNHFRRAAERARAQVKWHGWEASVVQVSRGEVERWEERMVEQMNS